MGREANLICVNIISIKRNTMTKSRFDIISD